jgi:site-specific DNA-methyltransferase (adenine-specific)
MNKHLSEVTNEDCMEGMARYPDKYFDLAIVDPPYGIGEDGGKNHSRCGATKPTMYTAKNWDSSAPKKKYFDELLRVSKNTIIWGANHFIENIPHSNSSCWIVWDKQNGNNDFADCELAWTNYKSAVRKFEFRWAGMFQGDMKNKETRIHPTQKPVALYKWLLHNYAKQGDKILDTHLGSGSSRIAAYEMGFDFTAFELDTEYYEAQEKRYKAHIAQLKLELI